MESARGERTTPAPGSSTADLPGAASLLAARVRERVARAGKRGIAQERLLAELTVRPRPDARERERAGTETGTREGAEPTSGEVSPSALAAAVERLLRSAELVRVDDRLLVPAAAGLVGGTMMVLPSGDALVRAGDASEATHFVPADQRGAARAGDLVLARPSREPRRRGRGPRSGEVLASGRPRLPLADVVATARRRSERLVGTLRAADGVVVLEPFDPKLDEVIRVTAALGGADPATLDGVMVVVSTAAPRPGRPLAASVDEVLGRLGEPGVDLLAILRHHRIPEPFPPAALAAAERLPEDPVPADWRDRLDLRQGPPIVTIDGETARDFDDAVAAERLPGGGWRVGVHIADVSHYVTPGSALDLAAFERGTSVYFPERAIPMLPERLSNGLCSLRPEVPRLAFSAFFDVDPTGQVGRRRFARSVIASARRMTYGEVRRLLEEPRAEDAATYGPVLPAVRELAAAAAALRAARMGRGSLDFDLPDAGVLLDEEGTTVGIAPHQRTLAHRLIEDLMIAANEVVASELEAHGVPALFRAHDPPAEADLAELRTLLAGCGLQLPEGEAALDPRVLQGLLRSIAGRDDEALIAALVVRAQRRALYTPDQSSHYALASRHYCHFTSPIRRYPDLLVHRQLGRLLAGTLDAEEPDLAARLPAIGEHASATERRAEAAERELLQWKKVRFLADRVGERFVGLVTGVTPAGLFVQLAEFLVDGFLAFADLDEPYRLEAAGRGAVGERSNRRLGLGQRLTVRLAGVDGRRRSLILQLVADGEPAQGGGGRSSPWRDRARARSRQQARRR